VRVPDVPKDFLENFRSGKNRAVPADPDDPKKLHFLLGEQGEVTEYSYRQVRGAGRGGEGRGGGREGAVAAPPIGYSNRSAGRTFLFTVTTGTLKLSL
jgi:hypothetical protein